MKDEGLDQGVKEGSIAANVADQGLQGLYLEFVEAYGARSQGPELLLCQAVQELSILKPTPIPSHQGLNFSCAGQGLVQDGRFGVEFSRQSCVLKGPQFGDNKKQKGWTVAMKQIKVRIDILRVENDFEKADPEIFPEILGPLKPPFISGRERKG